MVNPSPTPPPLQLPLPSTPLPTFSNINVGVKSMITQHLNKENTRWVFIPGSTPDIWTGAGYRKQGNNNGIPFEQVKPSNSSTPFNPSSMENQVTPSGGSSQKNYHLHPFTQQYQSHQWLLKCLLKKQNKKRFYTMYNLSKRQFHETVFRFS
ncbi:MgPa adhesin [Mycoplasmoides genitalium M6320]|uniref:MgPa adhesin n=1 Tax=Mycoplasmoides genitalium M6320 TaxID=662945 RepID=A0ABC7ZI41_MYCGT|nr:MgPa adhesin [Mycoplasmoides genitalium M6320]